MCIRDSGSLIRVKRGDQVVVTTRMQSLKRFQEDVSDVKACLLYTSDAADERSSVDLGGRRIIKQNKPEVTSRRTA